MFSATVRKFNTHEARFAFVDNFKSPHRSWVFFWFALVHRLIICLNHFSCAVLVDEIVCPTGRRQIEFFDHIPQTGKLNNIQDYNWHFRRRLVIIVVCWLECNTTKVNQRERKDDSSPSLVTKQVSHLPYCNQSLGQDPHS